MMNGGGESTEKVAQTSNVGGSWFSLSSLVATATSFADEIAENIVAKANAAQHELAEEQEKVRREEQMRKKIINKEVLLPWETEDESKAILSQSVMEKILALSLVEQNFTVTPPHLNELPFTFEAFVPVAMRLLQLDANLARMHAKLSPKMNEEIFWQLYHYRLSYLRCEGGLEDDENVMNLMKNVPMDIIFTSSPPTHPGSTSSSQPSDTHQKAVTSETCEIGDKLTNQTTNSIEGTSDEREKRRILDAQLAAEVEAELDNEDLDLVDFEEELNMGVEDYDEDIKDMVNLEVRTRYTTPFTSDLI